MFYPATTIKASAAEYIASSFRPFFKEKVEGNIGIELEFPILSVDEKPWPKTIIRSLNHFIQNSMNFESVVEVEGQPLVFQHPVWRDKISYEVTHSTLEFSMAPRNNIVDLEHSFKFYYLQIQDFLLGHNVFLACTGLHPFGYYRRHPALPHPHYLNITEFLRKYSKGHSPEFAFAPWLMIGSQTHIEAPWSQLSRFLNAYFSLGWCELILMANSYRSAPGAEWLCYRDYLIRGSGFGYNPENVNYPNQFFSSNNEYFERYSKKSIFTKKDGHQYLHFQPVKLEQIFAEDGLEIKPGIELMPSDVKNCLAFNPVRLTRYGTLEIRSTCQQPFDDLFAPAAFHLGIATALDAIEDYIPSNWSRTSEHKRKLVNRGRPVSGVDLARLRSILCEIEHAVSRRGFGEEKYLVPLMERLERSTNPALAFRTAQQTGQKISDFLLRKSLPK